MTDIIFDPESGEAIVYLDTLEQHPCPCDQEDCGQMVHDQAYRVFCRHSAAMLRAYLDRVAADPRTPIPEVFREQG